MAEFRDNSRYALENIAVRDRGFERGQQSKLAQLVTQAWNAPQEQQGSLLAQIAGINPQVAQGFENRAQKRQETQQEAAVNIARAWKSSANATPEQRQAFYDSFLRPRAQSAGLPLPQTYDPDMFDREADALIAMGDPNNTLAPRVVGDALVDARGKVLYQAPQKQEYQWSDRAASWIPKPMSAAVQPEPNGFSAGTGDSRYNVDIEGIDPAIQKRLADTAAFMKQAGYDDAAITSFIEAQLPKDDAQAYEQAPPALRAVPVAGIGPKVDAITPYQQAQLDLSRDRMRAAQEARDAANKAKEDAASAKALAAQQKDEARQVASAESANGLISAIDTLIRHPGYRALGTVRGDAQISTPFVRSQAKDADAQLKNISGQVALATMNQLKALSSQGATGFGALSAPELSLLQNSIATLQRENISNDELTRSLKIIREKMTKIANWKSSQASGQATATQQPSAPASGGGVLRYNPATGDFE